MEAKAAVMRRQNELRGEQMASDIDLEQRRKDLVEGQASNTRKLAEAEAHKVSTLMQALEKTDPRVVQALAAAGRAAHEVGLRGSRAVIGRDQRLAGDGGAVRGAEREVHPRLERFQRIAGLAPPFQMLRKPEHSPLPHEAAS